MAAFLTDAAPASLIFFRHRRRLHVKHFHPVLDSLQADRHLGQHADGLFLRFGLFKAGNDIQSLIL